MLLIRPARPSDFNELERIEKLSFRAPNWRAANFLGYRCAVAEIEGKVAGFLVSRTVFEGNEANPSEQEILNLAVDPAFRRRGIALALLETELRQAASHFYLEVRESNISALQLYEKVGFKEIGRRPEYYSHPVETAIVMGLK